MTSKTGPFRQTRPLIDSAGFADPTRYLCPLSKRDDSDRRVDMSIARCQPHPASGCLLKAWGEVQTMGTTRLLAEFANNTRYEQLSDDVVRATNRLLLESLAVSVLGSRLQLGITIGSQLGFDGISYALPDRTIPSSIALAAFANAAWADCNDSAGGSYKSPVHPAKNLIPSVLAVGFAEEHSGRDMILAAALGIECVFRIDLAIGLEHLARGQYSDGTIGTLGSAIAVGKARGLSVSDLEGAIGNAGLLAPATVGGPNMWASPGRPLALGQAASSGILAVDMAMAGVRGPADVLECEGGFADAMAGTRDLERVTRDLGVVWESTFHYLKPFVGCKLTHPARQGIQELKRENHLHAADVDRITVYHPLYDIAVIGGHPEVGGDEIAHSVSSAYLMANTLLYDDDGPGVLSPARLEDAALHNLADRIVVLEDPQLTRIYEGGMEARGDAGTPIRMEVVLKTGETHTYATNRVKGDPIEGWEVTDEELEEKFREYVDSSLDSSQATAVLAFMSQLEDADDLGELALVLRG
jgi:2-methylcitrate dehydratase PrpD